MLSIIIIGNEILSGRVRDTNLTHMLDALAARSYSVDEVRIIPDDVAVIRETVRALSRRSEWVISTGGVGPTHDDVTLEGYAAAFEQPLILHPELERRIRGYFGDDLKESALRMARVPADTELIDAGPRSWPLIKVYNCFVLPGLPEVFVKKLEAVLEQLPQVPEHIYGELFTSLDESSFAAYLSECQEAFAEVEIGSYPTYDRTRYAAKVTVKGVDALPVNEAFTRIRVHFERAGVLVEAKDPHYVR